LNQSLSSLIRILRPAGWLAAAFFAGLLWQQPRAAQAQSAEAADTPMVEVRGIGADSHLIVHYPRQGRMYVYNNAFTGAPKRACAYFFRIGAPGEPLRRELCPNDMSDR
jgi:hypothetical protein